MNVIVDILRVFHVLSAIFMAWPYYALVAVRQRALLGPPLGDRTDVYMENIIKNRTIPCFVFQGTVLLTGMILIVLRGFHFDVLLTNPVLGAKFGLLLVIATLLTYVHVVLQPRIDVLFAGLKGQTASPEIGQKIGALRLRRKRLATVCLFCVLTMAMLGIQAWVAFPGLLTGVFILAIALFSWRAYKTVTPYGWF